MNCITVDGFCGGGGWSEGFEQAIGEPVTIGINHDEDAISMHKANHPATKEWQCSACKETEWRTSASRLKYCPFCGAMMDGGAD